MKFDMVIADFDGTFGRAPNFISSANLEAVEKYKQKGGIFAVCTGRILRSIRNILLQYGFDGKVIACQGAIIADVQSGAYYFHSGIDYALAADVVRELIKDGEYALLDYNDMLCYDRRSEYTDAYERLTSLSGLEIANLAEFIEEKKTPIQKVMTMCEPERMQAVIDKYTKHYGGRLLINSGSNRLVEIVNPECSKGLSTLRLAKMYGIPPEKVLTIGDSTNDLGLMGQGFYGVAVGDGSAELKAAACEIAPPFDKDPVAYMLNKYCL